MDREAILGEPCSTVIGGHLAEAVYVATAGREKTNGYGHGIHIVLTCPGQSSQSPEPRNLK